jgi:hypothetical protein
MDAILGDYLEGTIDGATRRAAAGHLGECLRCASLVRDLEGIRRDAARLPVLEPSHDLWNGIAARIETPVIALAQPGRRSAAGWRSVRVGLAAAGLMAVTAGVTYLATARRFQNAVATLPPDVALPGAVAGPAGDSGSAVPAAVIIAPGAPVVPSVVTLPGPAPAAVTFDLEIARLRTVVDLRRNDLDPATVAIVEHSLGTIDRAVSDARAALARDPASVFLTDQLNKALEKKLGLLRTVALLPART